MLLKNEAKGHLQKLEARWEHGTFVRVRSRSKQIWVAIKGQVLMVRSVERIPVEQRCGADCAKWVSRAPWNKYNGDEYADGDVPEEVEAPEVTPEDCRGSSLAVVLKTRETPPREFYILKRRMQTRTVTRRGVPAALVGPGVWGDNLTPLGAARGLGRSSKLRREWLTPRRGRRISRIGWWQRRQR